MAGFPDSATDRGRQFKSTLWKHLMQILGSTRTRTTAYHPAANGLIERFHRQLKASLKACQNPSHWVDSLPLVLLGVRTALKEDLGCSTAELVYGTTLRLPGEYFCPVQKDSLAGPAEYVVGLREAMQRLKATPTRKQPGPKIHVSKDLSSTTHVFIRQDAVRKPLQQPYSGPHIVLSRSDKHFTVDIHGQREVISLDRLKPAHLDVALAQSSSPDPPIEQPPPPSSAPPPTTITRSGRHVHFPQRLNL